MKLRYAFGQQVTPSPITLRSITPDALTAFETTWLEHPRLRAWRWRDLATDYRRNEPDRFEVAIWSGSILCGLALGKLRRGYCSGNFLEGSPVPRHPLRGKVLPAALTALTTYAAVAVVDKRRTIRLVDLDPDMIPRYSALGFVLASPKRELQYCWKVVP